MKKTKLIEIIRNIILENQETSILKKGDNVELVVDDRRLYHYGVYINDKQVNLEMFNKGLKNIGVDKEFLLRGNTIESLETLVKLLKSKGINASFIEKDTN